MIMEKIFANVFGKLSSDDKQKIQKRLNKDKDVNVSNLISKRYFSKGSDGHFTDDDAKVSLDEYDGEVEADVKSTAIDDVKYDKKNKVCWVKYVGGRKWYRFINVGMQQFMTFMNASSKGKYVENVMRVKNHDPAFPVTKNA